MLRKGFRWFRARRRRKVCLGLAVLFVVANAVVYRQAYTMTHFGDAGAGIRPQDLSLWQKAVAAFTGFGLPRPTCTRTPADVGLRFDVHRFSAEAGATLEG